MTQSEFHHAKPVYEYFDGWNEDISGVPDLRRAAEERPGLRAGARGDVRRPVLGRRRRPRPRGVHRPHRRGGLNRGRSRAAADQPGAGRRRAASTRWRWRCSRDPGVTAVHAAPGQPGHRRASPTLHAVDPVDGAAVAALAERARRRPGRRRPRGAAGRRGRRRRPRRGHRLLRPVRRGRAARGLQGLRQGGDGRGRRAHRRRPGCAPPPSEAARRARRVRRAVRRQGRRARRRQGRRGHRRPGGGAARTPAACDRVRHRGVPRRPRGVAVRDHRRHDGRAAAAGPGLQARPATATPARTPAAWAPTRRCPGRRPAWSRRSPSRSLQPTVDEMRRRGTPFAGLLYAGLALTRRGIRVVEFNARFGDPETQPLLALLASPLAGLLRAAADGTLADLGPLHLAATAPPWRSSSPPRTTRRRRAPVTRSSGLDGRRATSTASTCSTPAPPWTATAPSSPPAAGCSP